MSLVERIKELCSRRGSTLIGLERELGLGRGTIRNWDENSPSVDKVQKIADHFTVSMDYLIKGESILEKHCRSQLQELRDFHKSQWLKEIEQAAIIAAMHQAEINRISIILGEK